MKSTEREKKSEWIRPVEGGLPKQNGLYSIKLPDGRIIRKVLCENGVFWKMKKGSGGQTWPAIEYRKEQ